MRELVSKNEKWRDLRGSGPFAGMTTVMLAAKFGSLEQFNLILEKKPDLSIQDELGKTVLHHLLERKGVYTKHLKNLIEARAPINHRDINLNTPLHLAAEKEGIESLELLIQHGGYLEAMNLTGKSPLMIAAAIGKEANVKLAAAQKRLAVCQGRLNELTATFEKQMAQKQRIEDGARALERKMDMASKLILGLSDEQIHRLNACCFGKRFGCIYDG